MKLVKKVFKNRIFIFITTALIFSVVGVTAATYFESSAVTYDNSSSGLSSTNVQGAIDELYNVCKEPGPLDGTILEDVPIVTVGDGLYEDEYEEGRYIYKGGNPNNYITFNNEKAGWRIISIESDKTIKIMKVESIGNMAWDTVNLNNWKRPATLNTYLNEEYYVNFLNETAKNQIVAGTFSIGAVTFLNNDMSTQVSNENSNKWYGKIALSTVSEYIRTNSNKSSCGSFSLIQSNSSSCASTGWMNITNVDYWWSLSPYLGENSEFVIFSLYGTVLGSHTSDTRFGIRPALYLSSDIKITGGDGSQNNPYEISL